MAKLYLEQTFGQILKILYKKMEKSTKLIIGTVFLMGGLIAANKTNNTVPTPNTY